ncbi:HEAT domain containing protein [Catenulispora acidiphila DSM 44928]|uniref:HEAT domain containing protein n=1 Tax=Catenulispora acidiphila (strain DSM 44928 / JCM 14897 / NBRC 102108 / NRRL B-24433 / ID139908) TaxID=479433 RepID=C7QD94_CATAD|nr:fumarate reductase/succinate dehydrogenase flavoprotein subunit [Catenulispora acidiphila]ACU72687.1 HEAT domain containing protein [Catenulispora acidiphila DSM 44928]
MQIPAVDEATQLDCDVLVIGGGTAGTMAALTAAGAGASVLVLEKAHVRHSGALAMGMDGVNNAVIPGKANPREYVADVTRANDGIVNQNTIHQTATRGFAMVQRLEKYGVKFEKDEHGEYAVRKVHRSGSYVLPMPEGKDVKKVLYRVMRERSMRERIRIENRVMPVRVLTEGGRAVGAAGFDTRSGAFVTVRAGAVILATGPCGRLGLPASGYLYGTYENPTNAGDGYSMAYHAGAELSGIECFQINPLIKDYNGPACAYVANPFGGYQVNALGERFVDCDYWSGTMMAEVAREVDSARGPVYLRTTHLPEHTISALEGILHTTERPTRGTFHANRGHDYRSHDVEMHISEIGLCGGHSASGVWVDENAATTVPGLYAAGDLACVPHNYMIGAFVFGDLAGAHAAERVKTEGRFDGPLPADQIQAAHDLVYRPLRHSGGPPQPQVEYKLRRFVNDYVAPPKTGRKLAIAVESFERMAGEVAAMGARTPHELMRCAEVSFILDCALMAAKSSLVRTESRWGLYHDRADLPERDDVDWFAHLNLRKGDEGEMEFLRRPVAPYLVPVEEFEPPVGRDVEYLGPLMADPGLGRAGGLAPAADGVARGAGAGVGAGAGAVPGASASAGASAGAVPSADDSAHSRILRLLTLTEQDSSVDWLPEFLDDPAPDVRRAAIGVLTEAAPPEAGPLLVRLLSDTDEEVRRAAAAGLVELVEVLVPDSRLRDGLTAAARLPTDLARATAVDLLRALRLGDPRLFADALGDESAAVRAAGVRALVSLDEHVLATGAAADPDREVRIAVARGLTSSRPADLTEATDCLLTLTKDPDPLVRAAALEAAAELGVVTLLDAPVLAASAADPVWQVRKGAALALGAAAATAGSAPGSTPSLAAESLDREQFRSTLISLSRDPNADVRRAAVLGLLRLDHGDPAVAEALAVSRTDSDADVRAYAAAGSRHA